MTRLIAAALTVLLALPVPPLAAEEPRQYAGRAVADVLRELQPDLRIGTARGSCANGRSRPGLLLCATLAYLLA